MKFNDCLVIRSCGVEVKSWVSSARKRPKKPEFTGSAVLSVWGIPTFPHDIEKVFLFKRDCEFHV